MSSEQMERELLELAARADGDVASYEAWPFFVTEPGGGLIWNPLMDDGDAFRLAVKLRIDVEHSNGFVIARRPDDGKFSPRARSNRADGISYENDPLAATRLAITRAAAQLAKGAEK